MGELRCGAANACTLSHFGQEYAEASDTWLGAENIRWNCLLTGRSRNGLRGVWDASLLRLK